MSRIDIDSIVLGAGNHAPPSRDGATLCVMELVAYVAGEPHSDHPTCACPVITSFLIGWNDALPNDVERSRLLRKLVPQLVGTRSTPAVELQRSWLALDWLAREYAPAWFELAGLPEHAAALRGLAPIVDSVSADVAHGALFAARAAAASASVAARAAAWAAAGAAARAAAGAAARAAAGAAARTAAWDAAWDAAVDAAEVAAWDAAVDAAVDALAPTVVLLQNSAVRLVRRMIAVRETAEVRA